jgi:ribonuclease-3
MRGDDESGAPDLDRLEALLGHRFESRPLLETALRHASWAHEQGDLESNERLEFLGDAVLGLVVAGSLYRAKPDWQEGALTRTLHSVVEGRSLARAARSLDLGSFLRLGRTERSSGGAEKPSILANGVEALIGALYLDGGLPAATAFVERIFAPALAEDAGPVGRDPKTELQERLMEREGEFPSYRLVGDSEIEGDDERFRVAVMLRDEPLAEGIGRTKRAAERRAARAALEKQKAPALDAEGRS